MNRILTYLGLTLLIATPSALYLACAAPGGGVSIVAPPGDTVPDPVATATRGVADFASTLNVTLADGVVDATERSQIQAAVTQLGQTLVYSMNVMKQQAHTESGGWDWKSILIQLGSIGLAIATGGTLGARSALSKVPALVAAMPNSEILGTEHDPDVARVAGLS